MQPSNGIAMALKSSRLDRYISQHTPFAKGEVRLLLAQKRVWVDGVLATSVGQAVTGFSKITVDDTVLPHQQGCYVMMHKPVGVVSATKDAEHTTVLDLLQAQSPDLWKTDLHIVGRLDLNSSGLLLLTNDSRWSSALMDASSKVAKRYYVEVEESISDACIEAFAQGMHFPYENITTRPATLTRLSANAAYVTLTEGRYHQIKRMFGRFRNPVTVIHRLSVGSIELDPDLSQGQSRMLTADEIASAYAG